jgi:hypothetical protein
MRASHLSAKPAYSSASRTTTPAPAIPEPTSPPCHRFLNMEWQPGIQEMAQKTFWYGAAIWLMRGSGLGSRAAIGIVAATLLLIEIAQTHIPGHTAEITDPLWAVFVGRALQIIAPPVVQKC